MTATSINTRTVDGREPSIAETCNTCHCIFSDAPPDDPQRYAVHRQSKKDHRHLASKDKQGRVMQECCTECVQDIEDGLDFLY